MASVVQEAVQNWKARLKELEAQIAPLAKEADEVRHAISLHPNSSRPRPAAGGAKRSSARRSARSRASAKRSGPNRVTRARKASSATRAAKPTRATRTPRAKQQIVQALRGNPGLTSSEVAAQTGLKRSTVATALSKMAAKGDLKKAKRGYRLP
jgi:DNA-binding NarL/FixJ family response regulator